MVLKQFLWIITWQKYCVYIHCVTIIIILVFLCSLNKGDSVVVVGFMGAPVITVEKLPSGLETSDAAKALTAFLPKVISFGLLISL